MKSITAIAVYFLLVTGVYAADITYTTTAADDITISFFANGERIRNNSSVPTDAEYLQREIAILLKRLTARRVLTVEDERNVKINTLSLTDQQQVDTLISTLKAR